MILILIVSYLLIGLALSIFLQYLDYSNGDDLRLEHLIGIAFVIIMWPWVCITIGVVKLNENSQRILLKGKSK